MSWQVSLYVAAALLPLAAFTVEVLGIRLLGRLNAYIATGAIALAFLLSLIGFVSYFSPILGDVFTHRVSQAGPEELELEHGKVPPPAAGEGSQGGHAPHKR